MKNLKFTLILALSLFVGSKSSSAQISKFKALYIYNISRYVQWPQSFSSAEFTIGIVGDDKELYSTLDAVCAQKTIGGKKIAIKKIDTNADAGNCHVIYFLSGKESLISSYAATAQHSLIITETSGSIDKGSGINFYIESNKLMFELKSSNILAQGLSISNELKSLAAKNL